MIEREDAESRLATPWGEASGLKHRRLYPGVRMAAEDVTRNQRERLFGAMVAVVSEKGYETTTVADVLALSGVSRSAFYRHFASKSECMTAAVTDFLDPAIDVFDPANRAENGREPQQSFEAFFRLLCIQDAAARAFFVELHAAGEEGEAVGDRGIESWAAALEAMLADQQDPGMPIDPPLVGALVGGLRKLIHTRLVRGEGEELPRLAPELWRWFASMSPPPGCLESPRRQRASARPAFQGYTPAERIAGAVAGVVAEHGYAGTTTDAIAAWASISLSTFYAHFADKQDAVLAALEMSGAQITALAMPAARRAGDWKEGVRAFYEAICAYFSAEPAMAALALVGVYGAGPRACRRRDRVIDSLAAMLAPGYLENPEAPAISSEAIAATAYSLMREQLRREGPESLAAVVPLATYITLVGFIGPEEALAIANGQHFRH